MLFAHWLLRTDKRSHVLLFALLASFLIGLLFVVMASDALIHPSTWKLSSRTFTYGMPRQLKLLRNTLNRLLCILGKEPVLVIDAEPFVSALEDGFPGD